MSKTKDAIYQQEIERIEALEAMRDFAQLENKTILSEWENRTIVGEWDGEPIHRPQTIEERYFSDEDTTDEWREIWGDRRQDDF